MSEIAANQSKTTSSAVDYFVLSYCLLVPTIGTLGLFVLLDHMSNERLVVGGAACVYLSSVILGLFSRQRFARHHGRAELWVLVVGIALSTISSLVAVGAFILSHAAAGLHIH